MCNAEWSSDLSRGWMDFNAGLTKNFCLCKLWWSQQNCFQIRKSWVQVFRSQSQFVNIYQRHTVLNVISDRRQFTLKSESELLLLVQLGLRRQGSAQASRIHPTSQGPQPTPKEVRRGTCLTSNKPEIFLGKETEFCSSFKIPLQCSSTSCRSPFFHFSPLILPLSRWNRKAWQILDNF